MPLRLRRSEKYKDFSFPISYRVAEKGFFKDALNVYTNQNILETRNGISRFNATAFSAAPLSLSFFQDNSDNNYLLAKDGSTLYKANATGAHTSLQAGLGAATKHRGITFNNRHIVAIESDGLFSYDGTTFTQLGQAAPTGISAAVASGGSLTDATIFQVGVTFYDSTNGFESNGFESSQVTTASPNLQIDVSSMPTTADNANIDKKRIYLKDVTNDTDYLFVAEISLATASYSITDEPTSSLIMPTQNFSPSAGGAKYLSVFNKSIAYAGNSTFPSDVFFSRDYLPDAFDQTLAGDKTINIAGNGPITGLATGYFNGDDQSPYLVCFKKRHIELYREVAGTPQQVVISREIGCVAHDTIQIINGDIMFMSLQGWHLISNGQLLKFGDTHSIDKGHISDIFTRSGFVYELNKAFSGNFFSVYYPTLRQYLCFIAEGSNNSIYKCYNYEFDIGGFRAYQFPVTFKAGCLGENDNFNDVVYLAGEGGYIYQHSVEEAVGTDVDAINTSTAVEAFAQMWWTGGEDLDASYNFGPFILRAVQQTGAVTVKVFLDYSNQDPTDKSYDFNATETGFILDVSMLDVGILSDGRQIVRALGNIFKTGQSLLIGFYKTQTGESIGLIDGQLDIQKNGAPH